MRCPSVLNYPVNINIHKKSNKYLRITLLSFVIITPHTAVVRFN